jgi:hypothetical protein
MSQPSNGITPDVIRQVMPPYQLSDDLLQATFAAIPAPPPDATPAWRHARIARLTQEISTLMPANAAQARIAAQILIYRELADTAATTAHAPGVTATEFSRLARTAATLMRTVATLENSLTRHQQKPAPFFGTVLSDQVDIAAVDATWGSRPGQPQPAPDAATPPTRQAPAPPNPSPPAPITPPTATLPPSEPQPQPDRPSLPAAPRAPDARPAPDATAATSEWTRTLLDQGPGWTREVLRHRSSPAAGSGSVPGAAAR